MGSRLTEKGQVTIPKAVRDGLGLRPGDDVEFVADGDGWRLRKRVRTNPFTRYRGALRLSGGHSSEELVREMRGDPPPLAGGGGAERRRG